MDIKKIGFAFVAIAAVMFGAGCIDSGPVATPVETPEPTFGRSTQIPQPERNDNAIFAQLVQEMSVDVGSYLDDLGTSLTNLDILEARFAAQGLEFLADVYIEDIDECVVTDDKQKIKKLVLSFLDEVRLSAIATQAGLPSDGAIEKVDTDKLEEAGVHVARAMVYWDRVNN